MLSWATTGAGNKFCRKKRSIGFMSNLCHSREVYFISGYRLNIADRIFPVLPLLVSELLTFNVNCLLNDDSREAGEIIGVVLERKVTPKIQHYDETVLSSLPNFFIQTAG